MGKNLLANRLARPCSRLMTIGIRMPKDSYVHVFTTPIGVALDEMIETVNLE